MASPVSAVFHGFTISDPLSEWADKVFKSAS